VAARASGAAKDRITVHTQKVHAGEHCADLLGELSHFEVGQPVIEEEGFCRLTFKLRDCFGASASLAHLPAQTAQAAG
jgi:hypothetical protein